MRTSLPRLPLVVFALALFGSAGTSSGCGDGGSGGSGGGAGGASSSTTSSTGTPFMWDMACHDCLADTCKAEIAACDSECVAIQACLDTICGHLATIDAAAEEGQCQVQCQNKHAGSKAAHIAVVNCAQTSFSCAPPCTFAPHDWEDCVKAQNEGACQAQFAACNGDTACQVYQACAAGCTTNAACQACSAGADGQKGQQLFAAYWQCVEGSCLSEAWLPQQF